MNLNFTENNYNLATTKTGGSDGVSLLKCCKYFPPAKVVSLFSHLT